MRVPVVVVVPVRVGVLDHFMLVLVLVPFGQMKPGPCGHQKASRQQAPRDRLAKG